MAATIAAIAISAAMIAWLCAGDPKRRRTAGGGDAAHGTTLRRTLAAASLVPGALLALAGNASAFLVWIGGAAMFGWLLALAISQRVPRG